MHEYVTHIYDSDNNDITGSLSPSSFHVLSSQESNYTERYVFDNNPSLFLSKNTNSIPIIYNDLTPRGRVFNEPETIWKYSRYNFSKNLLINGERFSYKDGSLCSIFTQDLVVSDDGSVYISLAIGSLTQVSITGGPFRFSSTGDLTSEYQNITPIVKFSSVGKLVGVEYIKGIVHAGHLCYWKDDSDDKEFIGFSVYSGGVGTTGGTSTLYPDGWNNEWNKYYFPSENDHVSFEGFEILPTMFNSLSLSDSDVWSTNESKEEVKNKLTFFADEVKTFGSKEYHLNQSYVYDEVGKNMLLGISITGSKFTNESVFRYSHDGQLANYSPSHILSNGSSKWEDRNLQAFYLRGTHKYLSYGGTTGNHKYPSLSCLDITKPLSMGIGSVVEQRDFSEQNIGWHELEGIFVDKGENYLYTLSLVNEENEQFIHLERYKLTNLKYNSQN